MEKYIKNHQQHKKNQLYFGSDSEIYISYIISKIISLSITQSEFSNQIIAHIPNECSDFTINRIKDSIITTNQNLSEMNKFTTQIMTNSKWGSQKDLYNISNKVNKLTIKKPRKHSELNSPLTRQFQLKKMNKTSSLGFFSLNSK